MKLIVCLLCVIAFSHMSLFPEGNSELEDYVIRIPTQDFESELRVDSDFLLFQDTTQEDTYVEWMLTPNEVNLLARNRSLFDSNVAGIINSLVQDQSNEIPRIELFETDLDLTPFFPSEFLDSETGLLNQDFLQGDYLLGNEVDLLSLDELELVSNNYYDSGLYRIGIRTGPLPIRIVTGSTVSQQARNSAGSGRPFGITGVTYTYDGQEVSRFIFQAEDKLARYLRQQDFRYLTERDLPYGDVFDPNFIRKMYREPPVITENYAHFKLKPIWAFDDLGLSDSDRWRLYEIIVVAHQDDFSVFVMTMIANGSPRVPNQEGKQNWWLAEQEENRSLADVLIEVFE